jgi:histidyl-tRNA synthetase
MSMGSLGGGGRYADLTGVFDLPGLSGVGISFGAERIYDLMLQLEKFPSFLQNSLKVLILPLDQESQQYGFGLLSSLRGLGIASDMYPEPTKMKKQMKYANDSGVPFVIVIGTEEMSSGMLTFKDMHSGVQEQLSIGDISAKLL